MRILADCCRSMMAMFPPLLLGQHQGISAAWLSDSRLVATCLHRERADGFDKHYGPRGACAV